MTEYEKLCSAVAPSLLSDCYPASAKPFCTQGSPWYSGSPFLFSRPSFCECRNGVGGGGCQKVVGGEQGASSKWSVSEVQVQTLSVFFGNTRKENPRFGGARRGRAGLRYQEREALNRPESDPVFDDNVQVFGCWRGRFWGQGGGPGFCPWESSSALGKHTARLLKILLSFELPAMNESSCCRDTRAETALGTSAWLGKTEKAT
ncbi:uncharacterized protein [Equus caballus]|uniref:uncharacterized protein n=1 Tax=Equus caballus TaxID=9796 RepID=UPI0038B32C7D